jgi:hypothetical protein
MMPKLSKLDSSAILSWFGLYNKVKDKAKKADDELVSLANNEQIAANPVLQLQINYYDAQRQRLCFKMEVMDDILSGMMEDLLENGSFEDNALAAGASSARAGAALANVSASLEATRTFIGQIQVPEGDRETVEVQRGSVGALDHVTRMVGDVQNMLRLAHQEATARPEVRAYLADAAAAIEVFEQWLRDPSAPPPTAHLRRVTADLGARRKQERTETLNRTASGAAPPDAAIAELDALRFADRMVHHAAKATSYLTRVDRASPADTASGDVADEPS